MFQAWFQSFQEEVWKVSKKLYKYAETKWMDL